MTPNTHETEVLEMLTGERQSVNGAWVNACLEFLSGSGYVTRAPHYAITEKGREWLRSRDGTLSY